jgi:prepilin-type N-terminal cleavage/methylation domain-containing protein
MNKVKMTNSPQHLGDLGALVVNPNGLRDSVPSAVKILRGKNLKTSNFKLKTACGFAASPAFTLMEMLVALAILVVMMGAIGEIFRIAGSVSETGQATLNIMGNVRIVQNQMAQDLGGFNTNGYLIIRQRWNIPTWISGYQYQVGDEVLSVVATPPVAGTTFYVCLKANSASSSNLMNTTLWQSYTITSALAAGIIPWRTDQIAFLANGNFQSRTGDSNDDIYNYLTSNAAAVWYGQLCISYGSPAPTNYLEWAQTALIPLGTAPTGNDAGEFLLGREAILLAPQAYTYYGVSYYADINYSNAVAALHSAESGFVPYITSSRVDAVNITPDQIMKTVDANSLQYNADNYCYRFATVRTPAASEITTSTNAQLTNGYFRMMPILLQGVPSFAVDWTDGTTNASGQVNWYGIDTGLSPSWTVANVEPTVDHNDNSMYVFYPINKYNGTTLQWPVALRITYTVTDPANRLQGGSQISQIIYLSH